MKYLLDTNIIVHLLRGRKDVIDKIRLVGWDKCCISEMTIVELFYGAEISQNREANYTKIEQLLSDIEIIPFGVCIREYCRQKALLKKAGNIIEDFDLFIGSTAIASNCIMISENINHLSRLDGIQLENWVKR